MPKADSLTPGRESFVKPASPCWGPPPHGASCWLLSAQLRAPQTLAPSYHICLVEKWVGPTEQIYCVSSALGSIPAAQNWSDDKEKCVWLRAQSLRLYLAPAVIKNNAAACKALRGHAGRYRGGAGACSLAACNLVREQGWLPEDLREGTRWGISVTRKLRGRVL